MRHVSPNCLANVVECMMSEWAHNHGKFMETMSGAFFGYYFMGKIEFMIVTLIIVTKLSTLLFRKYLRVYWQQINVYTK